MAEVGSNQAENEAIIDNKGSVAMQATDPIPPNTAEYINNGLTFRSNNTDIVPRDANGNIIVQDGSYIVIEPTVFRLDNISALKVLDTSFNYFKFPVTVNTNPIDLDLDFEFDNISAKYTIARPIDSKGQPANYARINTTTNSTWFYNDITWVYETNANVETYGIIDYAGTISKGFKDLTFSGGIQENANSYTIKDGVFNTLKQQNKTLRFIVQVQFSPDINDRTSFVTRITRRNPEDFNPLKSNFEFVKNSGAKSANNIITSPFSENPYGFKDESTPFLKFTYIVDMSDTKPGDVYTLQAMSGNPGAVLLENCAWRIDPIDDPAGSTYKEGPGVTPLYNQFSNIYNINENTVVLDNIEATYNDAGEEVTPAKKEKRLINRTGVIDFIANTNFVAPYEVSGSSSQTISTGGASSAIDAPTITGK